MRNVLACAGLIALTACGGGDGSGSGGGNVPTPAPTPTPTPPPPPPPPTATARVYGSSPATGRLDFYSDRTRENTLTQGFVTRDGLYYPGYANALVGYIGIGAGADLSADNSVRFKVAGVTDHETSMSLSLQAPEAAKMITPVTSLLFAAGADAAKLKTQLGITGSLFGMVTNPDLATYDAIAEAASSDAARAADAARMAAANVRALAIGAGLEATRYRAVPTDAAGSVRLGNLGYEVSECLRDAPAQFIFTNDRMTQVAQCFVRPPDVEPRETILQAVAHLINAYAAAMPVRLETPDDKARWLLGLSGYLVPTVALLVAADTDAAAQAALAVTTQTILDETARYVDHYTYNATGLFMPGPDFLTIAAGDTVAVPFATLRLTDIQYGSIENGGVALGGTLQSVAVPAVNSAQVAATRDGDTISVSVAAGFRGVTFFDYVTRSDAGEDRPARVYIRAY